MELWYIRKHYGAEKLWHSYLAYRVQNETEPEVGRYVEIRKIADEFSHESKADYKATIDGLCWLALERGAHFPGHKGGWWAYSNRNGKLPNADLNILSAAAYFDCIPLARRFLSKICCPTSDNYLFPSPIQIAAWAGNKDMLALFQEHLPEFEEIPPRYKNDYTPWLGKTGPGSIKGAALSGDINMLRLAIYPLSRLKADSADFCGQNFGQVSPRSMLGSDLRAALYYVKTAEAFQYIESFFKDSSLLTDSSRLLAHYTELGNEEMVRYLLGAGADIHGENKYNLNPLLIAARYCHEDIVNLLLEYGADPNNGKSQQRGSPLYAATAGGSVPIVKKLIDHGAKVDESDWVILRQVARLESRAMLDLLLDRNIGSKDSWLRVSRRVTGKGHRALAKYIQQRTTELSS